MATIHKFFNREMGFATVTEESYARDITYINRLYAELKKDFPDVDDSTIGLCVFGPPRRDRMLGLQVPVKSAPEEYFVHTHSTILCDFYRF